MLGGRHWFRLCLSKAKEKQNLGKSSFTSAGTGKATRVLRRASWVQALLQLNGKNGLMTWIPVEASMNPLEQSLRTPSPLSTFDHVVDSALKANMEHGRYG